MSKARVVVLEIVSGRLSVAAASRTYKMSRQHIYRMLARYRAGGLDAVDPRSRRPASNSRATSDDVIAAIVHMGEQLTADGLDAGPLTLQWHLTQAGLPVPSTSTIRRILHHHGLINPQPRKRPRSSHHRVSGPDVVATFTTATTKFGLPAATLTDNGSVYTSRFTGGHNDFERLIASLGVIQKNGHPAHPQTQGKIERFHQTLKRWLSVRPRPATIAGLPTLLDTFTTIYNTQRIHRAHPGHLTPEQAYLARPKAHPPGLPADTFRIRHDVIDHFGKLTLRHGSHLHHLGIGRAHAGTPVLILVTSNTVTIISKAGHHVLATHDINPDKNCWPNKQKNPGTRPGNP